MANSQNILNSKHLCISITAKHAHCSNYNSPVNPQWPSYKRQVQHIQVNEPQLLGHQYRKGSPNPQPGYPTAAASKLQCTPPHGSNNQIHLLYKQNHQAKRTSNQSYRTTQITTAQKMEPSVFSAAVNFSPHQRDYLLQTTSSIIFRQTKQTGSCHTMQWQQSASHHNLQLLQFRASHQ
ncbi:hypothetical protein Nepgr_026609 [Nepenthes gracilis]|uniref:Uncharacterized protein n=1 Tax=Nepenthes gracilis TaxID=150966 RepID=A0AAD3Y2N5_NEPGR|nr:hypothetical protein Nepgr_026609 [Nepenthes gracilis]